MELKKQKVNELRKEFEKMITDLEGLSNKGKKIHEMELHIFQSLLKLGRELLLYYIYLVSDLVSLRGRPEGRNGKKLKNVGKKSRNYRSVFGLLSIERKKYYSKEDKVSYVLDQELGLPQSVYSYVLSDWLAYGATEMDFDQSVRLLERILVQDLKAMQSSRVTYGLSEEVANFYEEKNWEEQEQGTHLNLGIDGKGIRIIRRETGRAKQSTSVRLGKGKRKGLKKEATVVVSSSFTPRQRSVEEIISVLFEKAELANSKPPSSDHKFHENKHMRGFLSNKTKGITYGIDNLIKRDPEGKKPIIILIDGEPVLRKQAKEIMENKGLGDRLEACVLDFIHVLEKVWKVANAYKGEKAADREAWVEQQARLILNSQTEQAIQEWERIGAIKKYPKSQEKNIKDAINYCKKRLDMMDYKTFLQKGYPITTGAVESACGHFVKSRMERNGMHWGKTGAQKMLDIRAIKKNGDWDDYIQDFINKEQEKCYKLAA